jgi:small GTP-binding protein
MSSIGGDSNGEKTEPVQKCQLLIIGDSTVGKTSILYSYVDREHSTKHVATSGIDFFPKDEKFGDITCKVKIWDTAGQERYKSLTNSYFKNSQGIILVYDLSNRTTFNNLKSWIEYIKLHNRKDDQCLKNIIIIGNKLDLKRDVDKDEVAEFCQNNNMTSFEVSAKGDLNIKNSIRQLVANILKIDVNYGNESKSPVKQAINNEEYGGQGEAGERTRKKNEDGCKCMIF